MTGPRPGCLSSMCQRQNNLTGKTKTNLIWQEVITRKEERPPSQSARPAMVCKVEEHSQ